MALVEISTSTSVPPLLSAPPALSFGRLFVRVHTIFLCTCIIFIFRIPCVQPLCTICENSDDIVFHSRLCCRYRRFYYYYFFFVAFFHSLSFRLIDRHLAIRRCFSALHELWRVHRTREPLTATQSRLVSYVLLLLQIFFFSSVSSKFVALHTHSFVFSPIVLALYPWIFISVAIIFKFFIQCIFFFIFFNIVLALVSNMAHCSGMILYSVE